jgi:hypothetical protein
MEILSDTTKFKIYKISSLIEPDLIYYGHTSQPLKNRFLLHKSSKNKTSSKIIFEKGDAEISLVEEFICNSKREAEEKESYYILNNNCVNKNNPIRKKYDSEKIKQYNKQRILKLKDYILEQKKALLKYLENLFNLEPLQVDYNLCNPIEINDDLWKLCIKTFRTETKKPVNMQQFKKIYVSFIKNIYGHDAVESKQIRIKKTKEMIYKLNPNSDFEKIYKLNTNSDFDEAINKI